MYECMYIIFMIWLILISNFYFYFIFIVIIYIWIYINIDGATKEARALLSESEITLIQIQNFDDDGSIIEIEDTANDDNANDDDNEA